MRLTKHANSIEDVEAVLESRYVLFPFSDDILYLRLVGSLRKYSENTYHSLNQEVIEEKFRRHVAC